MKKKPKKEVSEKEIKCVYLETSTLLPLMYITPYTDTIIKQINKYKDNIDLFIHEDCLREIIGMLETSYDDSGGYYYGTNRWRDIPEDRASSLNGYSYTKGDAYSLLIGGNITPLENHNRFQAFLFNDLVDKSTSWNEFKQKIKKRRKDLIKQINNWINNKQFDIGNKTYPGWGKFYKTEVLRNRKVNVFKDTLKEFGNIRVSWIARNSEDSDKIKIVKGTIDNAIKNLLCYIDPITESATDIRCKFPWKAEKGKGKELKIGKNENEWEINRDKYHFLAVCEHAKQKKGKWELLVADGKFEKMCKNVNYYPGQLHHDQQYLINIQNLNKKREFRIP